MPTTSPRIRLLLMSLTVASASAPLSFADASQDLPSQALDMADSDHSQRDDCLGGCKSPPLQEVSLPVAAVTPVSMATCTAAVTHAVPFLSLVRAGRTARARVWCGPSQCATKNVYAAPFAASGRHRVQV